MGNIFTSVGDSNSAVFSGIGALAILSYIIYDARQKQKFRQKMINSLNDKKNLFEEQMNQVYLKDHVQHFNIRNEAKHPIYKIAITGGPCAGKSTSLQKIKNVFTEKGYRVLCVPEVPTMVVYAGGMILMSQFNSQQRVKFQALLIRFQMYAQDYFTKLAQMSEQPAIVLCDRGTVDPYAYIPNEQFQAVLDEQGWTFVTLRDRRYDRVVFMSSAANGAEEFYTLENNAARSEGIQLARDLDRKTLEAWTGHPHITVVPNVAGQSFNQKIDRAVEAVAETVGESIKDVVQNKFLIRKPTFPQTMKVEVSTIEEIFLKNQDPNIKQDKLKRRGSNYSFTYQRKQKYIQEDNFSKQVRKPITSLQFVTIKENHQDPGYIPITRERMNFIHNNLSYSIDVYSNIHGEDKVYILRFASKPGKEIQLMPDFIESVRNVTDDKAFKLREIARKKQ